MTAHHSILAKETYVQLDEGQELRVKRCIIFLRVYFLLFFLFLSSGTIYFLLSEEQEPLSRPKSTAETTQLRETTEIKYDTLSYLSQKHTNEQGVDTPIPNKFKPVDKVISCYYNIPSNSGSGQLLPSDINPHLCTHINIAFAKIVNKEINLNHHQQKAIKELLKLKDVNPTLKILLSIGGAGESSSFSEMVIDHASRKIFIKSLKWFLRNLILDGIDLDWEFPAVHSEPLPTKDRERQHFSQLLREIRAEYIREKRDYLLTMAAAASEIIVNTSYDIDQINLYTDYVNIMTYDFHTYTPYTPFTGLNSPLYARSGEKLFLSTLNINYTCNMFMRKGLDRNKIVIGIPTYGHSFNLVNSDNTNIGSPASGYGKIGSNGFVNYPDICEYIKNYTTQIHIAEDFVAQVPYLYRSHDWISFDTPISVEKKAQFIKNHNLRGAMIYSLNADDYVGRCDLTGDGVKFPLSHSVRNTLLSADKI